MVYYAVVDLSLYDNGYDGRSINLCPYPSWNGPWLLGELEENRIVREHLRFLYKLPNLSESDEVTWDTSASKEEVIAYLNLLPENFTFSQEIQAEVEAWTRSQIGALK